MSYNPFQHQEEAALTLLRLGRIHKELSGERDSMNTVSGQFDDAEEPTVSSHITKTTKAKLSIPKSFKRKGFSLLPKRYGSKPSRGWKPRAMAAKTSKMGIVHKPLPRKPHLANVPMVSIPMIVAPAIGGFLQPTPLNRSGSRTISPLTDESAINLRRLSETEQHLPPIKVTRPGKFLEVSHPDRRILLNSTNEHFPIAPPVSPAEAVESPRKIDILVSQYPMNLALQSNVGTNTYLILKFGRGNKILNHPGNVRLREEVLVAYRRTYRDLPKFEKQELAKRVLNFLRLNGCRFLSPYQNQWDEVGDRKALTKISQFLREQERG